MPDSRPTHTHYPSPARSIYGRTGPRQDMPGGSPRPMSTTMRWHGEPPPPPASISQHISSAVAKIPGLTPRAEERGPRNDADPVQGHQLREAGRRPS
jgi:hypothetical protein